MVRRTPKRPPSSRKRTARTLLPDHLEVGSADQGRLDGRKTFMTEIVFAIPIARGKEDADREMRQEMAGPRRAEYEAALKEAGVTRQAVWHQQTPDGGALVILYVEGSDPEAHHRFVNGDSDIARWFVQRMQEVHGRDVSEPPLPVEKILDFRV
jgi:hypothetical protein